MTAHNHIEAFNELLAQSQENLLLKANADTEAVYTKFPLTSESDFAEYSSPKVACMEAIQRHIGSGMWDGFITQLKEHADSGHSCPACFEDLMADFAITGWPVSVLYDNTFKPAPDQTFQNLYEQRLTKHKREAFEAGKELGRDSHKNPLAAIMLTQFSGIRSVIPSFIEGVKHGYAKAEEETLAGSANATKN